MAAIRAFGVILALGTGMAPPIIAAPAWAQESEALEEEAARAQRSLRTSSELEDALRKAEEARLKGDCDRVREAYKIILFFLEGGKGYLPSERALLLPPEMRADFARRMREIAARDCPPGSGLASIPPSAAQPAGGSTPGSPPSSTPPIVSPNPPAPVGSAGSPPPPTPQPAPSPADLAGIRDELRRAAEKCDIDAYNAAKQRLLDALEALIDSSPDDGDAYYELIRQRDEARRLMLVCPEEDILEEIGESGSTGSSQPGASPQPATAPPVVVPDTPAPVGSTGTPPPPRDPQQPSPQPQPPSQTRGGNGPLADAAVTAFMAEVEAAERCDLAAVLARIAEMERLLAQARAALEAVKAAGEYGAPNLKAAQQEVTDIEGLLRLARQYRLSNCPPEEEQKKTGSTGAAPSGAPAGAGGIRSDTPEQRAARLEAIERLRTGTASSSGTEVIPSLRDTDPDPAGQVRADVQARIREAERYERKDRKAVAAMPAATGAMLQPGSNAEPAEPIATAAAVPGELPEEVAAPSSETVPALPSEEPAAAMPPPEPVAGPVAVAPETPAEVVPPPPPEQPLAASPATTAPSEDIESALPVAAAPETPAEVVPPPPPEQPLVASPATTAPSEDIEAVAPLPPAPEPELGIAGTYQLADTSSGVSQVTIAVSGGMTTLIGMGPVILLEQDGDTYFGDGAVLFGQGDHQIRLSRSGNNLELLAQHPEGGSFTTLLLR